MSDAHADLVERCRKLGLECDTVNTDQLDSAIQAVACFPMYMVANVDAWTDDKQFRIPILDLPGAEHVREAFALGKQERRMDISKPHRRILGTLVSHPKPSDLVIYEYALDTLNIAFTLLDDELVAQLRTAIARMVVAVAKASGEGIGGTGPKVSPQERECIANINQALDLESSPAASIALSQL